MLEEAAMRLPLLLSCLSLLAVGCAAADASEPPTSTDDLGAGRTFVVRAAGDRNPDGQARAEVSLGFRDSSFDGDEKTFCYVGRATDVCRLVDAAAGQMQGEYSSGAHDTIAIQGCAVSGTGADAKVDVRYRLTDDYGGDLSVAKTIEACTVGQGADIFAATVAVSPTTVHVSASVGFYDSSFDTPTKAFCYRGQARAVCSAIEKHAQAMHEQYSEGAHDDMGLESCTVADGEFGEIVTAKYQLTDDWGGNLDVTRTIERCYDSTH
jgi:hypothetical protein